MKIREEFVEKIIVAQDEKRRKQRFVVIGGPLLKSLIDTRFDGNYSQVVEANIDRHPPPPIAVHTRAQIEGGGGKRSGSFKYLPFHANNSLFVRPRNYV
jgi:hypothetical protein